MVIQEGMTVIFVSVAIGVFLAMAGTSMVRHLLYGPGAAEARVYSAAAVVVTCISFFACWVPARRAASIEPLDALREE
jgi:ABC-type antimicrobial peptide transport system permease subunit